MKSITFDRSGTARNVLSITETTIPEIPEGAALVRVMARPVNPSDYMFINGQYRVKPLFPQIAGLEGSGIITAVHKSVNRFKPGDHVAFRSIGTWAEYVAVNENNLIAVSPVISFEIACQIALNVLTAYALLEESHCEQNSFLLLSAGASALSGLIIQLAKIKNIKTICLVRSLESNDHLLKFGAFKVLQQDDNELSRQIIQITGETGIHSFLDAVGGPLLSKVIKVMLPGGKIILYGRYSDEYAQLFNADVIYRNLTIQGFGISQWLDGKLPLDKQAIFTYLNELIVNGMLSFPQSHVYQLKDIAEALQFDESKNAGKVILIN